MKTDDFLFNYSCQRKPLEKPVNSAENRIFIVGIFVESVATFIWKPKSIIDPFILVVPSDEVDLVRVLDF